MINTKIRMTSQMSKGLCQLKKKLQESVFTANDL